MNQILQNLRSGVTELAEVPCPAVKPGHLLIRTRLSVVSAGTERMLVEFGKANLIDKARQQPDKVRQVVDKIKTDGLIPTLEAVRSKLDQPLALGYSNVGIVMEVGEGVEGFAVGDRVVSNGPHAEVVQVPKHLCAKVPETVDSEDAAFTVIASIGLQGIRLANPTLGETFAVTGLGLIGLMTVQLLRAHGCRVLGLDFDADRLALAKSFGAETVNLAKGEDPVAAAFAYTNGRGVDGVLITASTKSSEPVSQAARMCRKRGRIVLVGVTGLELSRADFYEKELTFQVSCSYGPGRYDPLYEQKGQDYPLGYVRWTEQRNFEAVLDMLAAEKVRFRPLVTHRYAIGEAEQAYRTLDEDRSALGIVLVYDEHKEEKHLRSRTVDLLPVRRDAGRVAAGGAVVGLIGAGNFAKLILAPALSRTSALLKTVVSSSGVSAAHLGRKFQFQRLSTDPDAVFGDDEINAVLIATPHNTHAAYVKEALQRGKHVFVEKPLCLTRAELAELKNLRLYKGQMLMVGFNRRFSTHARTMKQLLDPIVQPKSMVMVVNAGFVPADHWTRQPDVGGGRIIGEACHFIDLLRFLAGHPIEDIAVTSLGQAPGALSADDNVTITLKFEDGSVGTVHYFANGHKSYPKERLEVFAAGRVLMLDNFRTLTGYGWPNFKKQKLWTQDKGHRAEIETFIRAVENGEGDPIPLQELFEVTEASIEVAEQVGKAVKKARHVAP